MNAGKNKLSIDIGSKNIKILETSRNNGHFTVQNHLIIEIPEQVCEDGMILDLIQLSQILSGTLSGKRIHTKTGIVTIASSQILSREVLLPRVSLKEMTQLVRSEAPNHFPIDISSYHVDFKVLEEVEEEDFPQYKVMLLVSPHALVQGYVDLFERCGIFLEKIDFQGNSISKLMRQIEEDELDKRDRTNVVLDIGSESTGITIEQEGQIKFSRLIPFGSNLYNQELMEILGCSSEKAESIKIGSGIVSDEGEDPSLAAAKQAWVKLSVPLFDEVTRVLEFYSSRKGNNTVDRILITGGGSLFTNLIRYMQNSFDIQIEPLSFDSMIEFSRPDADRNLFSSYFANCLGCLFS